MLPKELPDWRHVWYYYKKWTDDGTWERLNDRLRRAVRCAAGKDPEPSLGILDSQSVKATEAGGERDYGGGKKINERKRHIIVDTLGLLLVLMVHSAHIQVTRTSESDVYVASIRMMLQRLDRRASAPNF